MSHRLDRGLTTILLNDKYSVAAGYLEKYLIKAINIIWVMDLLAMV